MTYTFFTTSTFSDIQDAQSKCIKNNFPNSQHVIIDGRDGWFQIWYKWLDFAKDIESDWYIHLDEDCFIFNDSGIKDIVKYMIDNKIDISGPPDGHFEYRSGNHMAFNSFFMIMNRKVIDTWHNRRSIPQFKKEWIEEYPFEIKNSSHYEYNMEWGSSGKSVGLIWKPNTEPYYDFMWVLKENNIKFNYLEPFFGEELQTTNLLNNTIVHMWHQRERWVDNIVSTAHKMNNKKRFDEILIKIKTIK